jgi:hypothetical protein
MVLIVVQFRSPRRWSGLTRPFLGRMSADRSKVDADTVDPVEANGVVDWTIQFHAVELWVLETPAVTIPMDESEMPRLLRIRYVL